MLCDSERELNSRISTARAPRHLTNHPGCRPPTRTPGAGSRVHQARSPRQRRRGRARLLAEVLSDVLARTCRVRAWSLVRSCQLSSNAIIRARHSHALRWVSRRVWTVIRRSEKVTLHACASIHPFAHTHTYRETINMFATGTGHAPSEARAAAVRVAPAGAPRGLWPCDWPVVRGST